MRALLLSTQIIDSKSVPEGSDPVDARYTSSSRTEGRSTLESEPSAGPDRNGAGAVRSRSFEVLENPFRPKR